MGAGEKLLAKLNDDDDDSKVELDHNTGLKVHDKEIHHLTEEVATALANSSEPSDINDDYDDNNIKKALGEVDQEECSANFA